MFRGHLPDCQGVPICGPPDNPKVNLSALCIQVMKEELKPDGRYDLSRAMQIARKRQEKVPESYRVEVKPYAIKAAACAIRKERGIPIRRGRYEQQANSTKKISTEASPSLSIEEIKLAHEMSLQIQKCLNPMSVLELFKFFLNKGV